MHTHTYTACFTDSPPSYTYIYIYTCSVSPHRVTYLFYRTDSPPLCIHIYTYILSFTTQSWHLFYLTDGTVLPHWGSQQSGWWLIYHHLIHITFVVVNFDALAQASDFRIERRQVVFLCWEQDSNPGDLRHLFASRLNACWQTDWANILFVLQITHHHTHTHIYIYKIIFCFTTQS